MDVITYNGIKESREDCVFIRGKWYHKRRDCYLYNGIYYSPFSRYLVEDYETKKRVHIMESKLSYGVVDFDANGKIVLGYFSGDIFKNGKIYLSSKDISDEDLERAKSDKDTVNVEIVDNGNINSIRLTSMPDWSAPESSSNPDASQSRILLCRDIDKPLSLGFSQANSSDIIARKIDIPSVTKIMGIPFTSKVAKVPYDFNLAYNSEVMMDTFLNAFKKSNFGSNDKTKELARLIGDFTYGIEYESWDGRIPTSACAKTGIIPLRDGSLRHDGYCGYEYASVIMSGESGLAAIKEQCELLKRYTTFNEKCSMHIHLGNIPRTKDNLIKIYTAILSIQDSLYSMFPSCLRHTSEYKPKDYCSPLPKIPLEINSIVSFISDGTEGYREFGRPHPKDVSGQSKWAVASRYSIANINNYYYTDRGTVELRVSTPTYNHNKVAALLLIWAIIIRSALNGKYYTDVTTMIIENVRGDIATWLIKYISYRISDLSGFSFNDRNVEYFENITNDQNTGNEESLY